ncbi:MAG: AlwI family type II restriction endonuclease, partial [Candidatus Cloacimonadota bacterium]|nr:AlwI family type II restriction endonuclease [Candidatus Cloacimonadota bacterium]
MSTTVRNPERLQGFLAVLKQIEGESFNSATQEKYQILLIKHRLYRPTKIPKQYIDLFKNSAEDISYDAAEKIFYIQKYEDSPMRGRQSVNPLNKLGFCLAKDSLGAIQITRLGNLFLSDEADLGYIFFKSMLKLQLPNPLSDDFTSKQGFNVRPLIVTMHLMKEVSGLTQTEFSLFVPTLTNYSKIKRYAELICKRRALKGKKAIESFDKKFLKSFYKSKILTDKQLSNPFEYGDNLMRYFRLTKYFQIIKGPFGGWRVNLEPSRIKEIEQLLSLYDGSAMEFKNLDEYIEYLTDINQPALPWELDKEKSGDIVRSLTELLKRDFESLDIENKSKVRKEYEALTIITLTDFDSKELESLINKLRSFRLEIIQLSKDTKLKRNIEKLKSTITDLKDKKKLRNIDPVGFEYIIAECFKIIDDEIEIKPNCILDDNGNPIGFAPGNRADIEGYYNSFNSIFEATLDVSRHQVYRESIPVMRHLKDFSIKNPDKPSYCIFIAPKIHDDTVNYFWYAVKFGFEGNRQKIVVLDLEHLIKILECFISVVENNKEFGHNNLRDLFESVVTVADSKNSSV